MNELFRNVREITIHYDIRKGLDSPFVQTFFDGILSSEGQRLLKSPDPICRVTSKPLQPHDLFNLHIKQISAVLQAAGLDGGGVHSDMKESELSATFTLVKRNDRDVGHLGWKAALRPGTPTRPSYFIQIKKLQEILEFFNGGGDFRLLEPKRLSYKVIDRFIQRLRGMYQDHPEWFEVPKFAQKEY